MQIIGRRAAVVSVLVGLVGLLALGLWPKAAPAQQAAQQDTLQAVIKRGELIVGTFDFFPPWGYRDAQNNLVGMDVDIAKDLAEQMKVKLTLVPVPTAPDRINFLVAGKIDVAISNFTATVERSKTITFTEPYVIDGFGVIFRKEAKIKDWPDLNGKKVAVTTGSTGEILVSQKAPKAQILRFDQASAALLAVQQGKADAQIEDYTYTVYHAGRDPKKSLGFIEKPFDLNPYAFGVRKNDQEWLQFLNFYIYKLHQSGKMKELYKKWFNAEPARVSPNW
jgi:polar amino acid transport system substrate-binding protein